MLTIASWPVIVAGIIGILCPHITDLLTKRGAPDRLKSQINLALVTLGGIFTNVATVDHNNVKKTLATIAVTWVMSLATHYADPLGTVAAVQNAKPNIGLGTNGESQPETYAGVKTYESNGPAAPPRSPGMATQARQSPLKSPRGQAPQ